MLLMRTKILFALLGCALAAPVCGCSAPWARPSLKDQATPSATAVSNDTGIPPASVARVDTAESEPDMTAVLDKLQQVRALDPAAEQKLLEELRRTPSKSWPLVAEQFRASLAYHEQLAAKNPPVPNGGADSADPLPTETGYDSGGDLSSPTSTAAVSSRPSAPIGTLVDPRNADADDVSSEELANATPYPTPGAVPKVARDKLSAPAEFIANETVYPITTGAADSSVIQARLETAGTPAANETKALDDDLDWQQLLKRAADDLNRRVAEAPATTAEVHQHASLRMLWLLAGDTEKALEPIPHISPAEQDYWSRQMFALATYLDHHSQPDDKRRAAASAIHLDDAMASLRDLGSLTLRNLTFCKNVYGYGSLDPFADDQFSPGQQLSLYVEVENYHSKSTEKGFCTMLGSTYELVDEKGERISGGEFPDVDDCCRGRRRDFHIQYGLAMPEKIAPGRYQLQLVVKDRQSDKIGHATAAFEIRGNRSLSTLNSLTK
jgi:hypothetical protein